MSKNSYTLCAYVSFFVTLCVQLENDHDIGGVHVITEVCTKSLQTRTAALSYIYIKLHKFLGTATIINSNQNY